MNDTAQLIIVGVAVLASLLYLLRVGRQFVASCRGGAKRAESGGCGGCSGCAKPGAGR